MTVINNDNDRFRSAADELNPKPKNSSWDRLETMLENDTLLHENKSYKNKLKWITGLAASLLLVGAISFLTINQEQEAPQQFAYTTESIELEVEEADGIYDINKLSILNDAELWVNLIEGGPKIEAKKM